MLELSPHREKGYAKRPKLEKEPMRIPVPDDVPRPTAELCWEQKLDWPNAMVRCDRKLGHKGKHSWEL